MRHSNHTSRSATLRVLAAAIALALPVAVATPASAHVEHRAGDLRLAVGWGDEPAYSGSPNFVQVTMSDTGGAAVRRPGDALTVRVSFGDRHVVLPLTPSGRPGELRAPLTPTRAGVYVLHVTGRAGGRTVDAKVTCSDETFDCVADGAELQFPVKEPSGGQVAQKLAHVLPGAKRTAGEAASATQLASGAMGVAAVALALAAALALRLRGVRKAA